MATIAARVIKDGPRFSGVFLAYMIVATFLALFFILYFNRAAASLASWALRTYTWHRYGIYVDIQALQFSLLGGRVFFIGLRYHGNNETILIQNGHITWAYWLRRVRHIDVGKCGKEKAAEPHAASEDSAGEGVASGQHKTKPRLPCRVNVNIAGLEWFVYNRSAAYDSIVSSLLDADDDDKDNHAAGPCDSVPPQTADGDGHHKLRKRRLTRQSSSTDPNGKEAAYESVANPKPASPDSSSADNAPLQRERSASVSNAEEALPVFLHLFPVHFSCDRAALVMGNENTSAIFTVKAQSLSGEIDAQHTDTPDPYRQVFKIRFQRPVVEMRENEDFREDQICRAVREKQTVKEAQPTEPISFWRYHRRHARSHLRNLVPFFRQSVESFSLADLRGAPETPASARIPGAAHWQGLSRYLDGPGGDAKTRWEATEYAMLNPLLESPEAVLTLFWDSVGKVTAQAVKRASAAAAGRGEDGSKSEAGEQPQSPNPNGNEPPPAWGMNLSIHGGSANYGPWADRKRAEIQRVFFPSLSKDAKPAKPLPVGASRVPTEFRVYVELDDEVTLRVPVREPSKNWRYQGPDLGTKFQSAQEKRRNRSRFKKAEPAPSATGQRPYGWLDIKIASNTTVSYSMDMAGTASGFKNTLDLDMPRVEISSSVNQEVLWRSGTLRTSCDLSTPLGWNALRQWHFDVTNDDLELFLLRDHVFLLTDLIDDWGTGPPPEYLVFTPFKYFLNLTFRKAKIYLNVNDKNIINNPTSLTDNTFIVVACDVLSSSLCIPLDNFRPASNAIPFSVRIEAATVKLHVPPWNTNSVFVPSKDVGHLSSLLVDGKYHYHTSTSTSNTDTLVLDVAGKSPVFTAYGFVVRYFMKLKDNYFGEDVHFITLEEHQEHQRLTENDPQRERANGPPPKPSNDLDIMLYVEADDPKIYLPANIYSAARSIQIDAPHLSADLRFTNYYMDLDFLMAPTCFALGAPGNLDQDGSADDASDSESGTQLFVDGLHVFGNRLFGLPPTEPTYFCNWDLSTGAVTGECTTEFITALIQGAKSFAFTFDDDENALVPVYTLTVHDVTFLRVHVKSVSIWLHVDEAAFLLSLGEGVNINYNDWAKVHYSKRADISIPDLKISCVNADSALRHKSRPHLPVQTDAFLSTSLSISSIGRKFNFTEETRLQQELVRREDQRTQRAGFILLPKFANGRFVPDAVDPPAQPVPPLPQPITSKDVGSSIYTASTSSRSSRRLRRQKSKSSFLSSSTLSLGSVVRPHNASRSNSTRSRVSSQTALGSDGLHPMATAGTPTRLSAASYGHGSLAGSRRAASVGHQGEGSKPPARRPDPNHNTIEFSSKYFMPYFPLETVKPDVREAVLQSVEEGDRARDQFDDKERGDENSNGVGDGGLDGAPTEFCLDDIDPETLSEDKLHSSILIRVHRGVTAFLNPTSAKHIAALLTALQPQTPEDILDAVQISSIDGIIGSMKHQKMGGQVQNFAVQLPRANLRFLNATSPDRQGVFEKEQDQYDVSVSDVTLMSRTTTTWRDVFKPEENGVHTSFHLRMGSVELSAAERMTDVTRPQAAFVASVEDTQVSMGTRDLTYLDADVKAIEGQLSSDKIEYVASLINRTGVLVANLARAFAVPLSHSDLARPHLAKKLVQASRGVADPGFLVRPSAVLRTVDGHLRTYDSWKLAMRLRQVWMLMEPGQRRNLMQACSDCALNPPASPAAAAATTAAIRQAAREVIAAFEQWRGWDLYNLPKSRLMQEMFTTLKDDLAQATVLRQGVLPKMAVIRVEKTQLLLDPGPKQNETTCLDLTVRVETTVAKAGTVASDGTGLAVATVGAGETTTVLNIYCSEAAIRLNWEICELAEDVLRLYKKTMQEKAERERASGRPTAGAKELINVSQEKDTAPPKASTFHVVLAMDRGLLILDTVNLNVRLFNDDVKASLLVRQSPTTKMDASFLINCKAISTRVKSHSESMLSSQLSGPSVFVAYSLRTTRSRHEHTIKATASSRDYFLGIKRDPLVLLETVDLLIRDEIAQLYQISKLFPLTPRSAPPARQPKAKQGNKKIADRLSAFSVNIALFLEQYSIRLPLLQSLLYTVSGVVARVAVGANFGKEVIFDFDVKENSHDMQITGSKAPRSISLLQIPPTNGRVTMQIGEHEQAVTVFSSLELVQLDAAAVYSLLSALNRPEISNAIAEAQQQIKASRRHLAEIFGSCDQSAVVAAAADGTVEKAKKPIVYSVHSTFAGLEIFGDVSLESDVAPVAHLSFCLASIRLEVTNRLEAGGPVLQYPELHMNLRRIAVEILKGSDGQMVSCGSMVFAALITATTKPGDDEDAEWRSVAFTSDAFDVTLSPDTVSTAVDVLGYMGDKIKDLDTSREMEYLRKLRQSKPRIAINDQEEPDDDNEADEVPDIINTFLSSMAFAFEIRNIQFNWLCALEAPSAGKTEDFVLLLGRIEFSTRTKSSARLTIENLQLQMVPPMQDRRARSANSALLPEIVFNVAYFSTAKSRRFAFQAVGKSLDLRLTSEFIVPASNLKNSIQLSIQNARRVSQQWNPVTAPTMDAASGAPAPKKPSHGGKRLESLLMDLDFAGAVVHISGKKTETRSSQLAVSAATFGPAIDNNSTGSPRPSWRPARPTVGGKYGQFKADEAGGTSTVLRSPGLALKLEYRDSGRGDPSLYAEVKLDASSNVIYPSVVPLVMDLTASVKEVVSNSGKSATERSADGTEQQVVQKAIKAEDSILLSAADPTTMLGRLKLNLGLRICKQQFTLSCQPIARVASTTSFDDMYFTMNTIRTVEHGNFFAISGTISRLQASVQHVYSRESTGSFEVDSIVLSFMNSRHVSGVSGVSALIKVSPMKVGINVRQVQDFLLFRKIWSPDDGAAPAAPRRPPVTPIVHKPASEEVHLVQRYQQVAATAAFPWTASIAIAALEINVDLGQALGKSVFAIEQFWVSSKKTSGWEQNLCLGFRRIGVDCTGRMSGFVALEDFKLRTSIEWPQREQALSKTPLVQAAVHFSQLRFKASFDYQPFLVADVRSMDFLMYNVRRRGQSSSGGGADDDDGGGGSAAADSAGGTRGDRLVAVFEGDAVQVFGTTTTAAQGVALYQAVLRVVQERKASYASSLREIERFTKRRASSSSSSAALSAPKTAEQAGSNNNLKSHNNNNSSVSISSSGSGSSRSRSSSSSNLLAKSPISLDTDVVVTLRAVNLGVFPNRFTDNQVFKMEALNAQARFAAGMVGGRIHSNLGLTLGQLRIGLAGVRHIPRAASKGKSKAETKAAAKAAAAAAATAAAAEAEAAEAAAAGGEPSLAAAKAAPTTTTTTTATPTTTAAASDTETGEQGLPKTAGELSVEDVVLSATGSRGGTILKVPQVEASMQTWQRPAGKQIDYIFKSAFEGKVEVGWNYSRISYIRGMYANHVRTLEQAWGRELPLTAIRLTGVLEGEEKAEDKDKDSKKSGKDGKDGKDGKGGKITAEVNMPQSQFEYRALEPAVIETPQLRDMGEATPPLEWIGLHRDRLPNLTHQIVIVSLLELAGEVEDAYARILGSS